MHPATCTDRCPESAGVDPNVCPNLDDDVTRADNLSAGKSMKWGHQGGRARRVGRCFSKKNRAEKKHSWDYTIPPSPGHKYRSNDSDQDELLDWVEGTKDFHVRRNETVESR